MGLRSFLKRRSFALARRSGAAVHNLRSVFFEITQRCNLRCLHCGSDCTADSSIRDLPPERVLAVLDEIRSAYDPRKIMVILSGGEPLCYAGVFELGAEMTRREFPWGMVTNGWAWTRETIAAAKSARMTSVTVSLDGLEQDHDWFRGRRDSHKRAVRTIEMLVADPFYRKMDVITCVNRRTLRSLEDIRALLIRLGVKQWRLFTVSPIGRAAGNPELLLNASEFKTLFDTIIDFRARGGIDASYSESGYLGAAYECRVRDHRFLCLAGISVAGIMANGDILACPNIDRRFAQGNIYSDSFVDVWEHRYRVFRNRSWMRQGECERCGEWNMCQGNSFHLWDKDRQATRLCYYRLLSGDDRHASS
jgi:radical SAM enzyme (rSAM/lipoprotein system)